MEAATRLEMDVAHARACATEVIRSAAEGGPGQVVVGNAHEHRLVDRRDALMEAHARWVLVYCRADPYRLAVLHSHCAARCEAYAGDGSWPYDVHAVAARVAAEALCLVREAGALTDPRPRARLLAGIEHQLNREVCAEFDTPELAGTPNDLVAELERIDNAHPEAHRAP